MRNKFFFGVVIFFLVTFFAFCFNVFRPFVGVIVTPGIKTDVTAQMLHVVDTESIKSADVAANI
ncbi:MAG TPA: hypothetical protein VI306_19935 [Pyrinomonadaceae bacterium]